MQRIIDLVGTASDGVRECLTVPTPSTSRRKAAMAVLIWKIPVATACEGDWFRREKVVVVEAIGGISDGMGATVWFGGW